MSIKIHHGPPGSYKTSGAIQDDFIRVAKEGRPVVTNVRGLDSEERVRAVLGKLPDTFKIIHVDSSKQAGKDKLARYFHWAPKNAFFIIDEAQYVWPKKWKPKDIEKLDYPGGIDAADRDDRPPDFITAFDMHRHHNWDMVLTTPKITKLHEDIRGAAEVAYKHVNRAIVGGCGYNEAQHLAEDNGGSSSHIIVRKKRIKKRVFKLYKSTATGDHRDTTAGQHWLKDPRILFLFAVLACSIGYSCSQSPPAAIGSIVGVETASTNEEVPQVHEEKVSQNKPEVTSPNTKNSSTGIKTPVTQQVQHSVDGHMDNKQRPKNDPFINFDIYVGGYFQLGKFKNYLFEIRNKKEKGFKVGMTHKEMLQTGYSITSYGPCFVKLSYQGLTRLITCRGSSDQLVAKHQLDKNTQAKPRRSETSSADKAQAKTS